MISPVSVPISGIPSVTAARMAEVDRLAIEDYGITLLQMMEQAGSHLAEVARLELGGDLVGRSIVVAVGPGNNGGGGLVAARHLANRGARVRVILARPALRMTEAARHQLATLLAMGTSCCVATYDLPDEELAGLLTSADLIIDAILGYNIDGPPHGEVARLIGWLLRTDRPILSLDVPSGLDPDTGSAAEETVVASATLTLALPKPGLLEGAGPRHVGRLYVADLGLPDALYDDLGIAAGRLFAGSRIVKVDPAR